METQTLTQTAQNIIDLTLSKNKFTLRRMYRNVSRNDKFSGAWMDAINSNIVSELKHVLDLVDGSHSLADIIFCSIEGKKIATNVK